MVPRPALMEAVFGFDDEIQSNALDSHISRLRRKLAASHAGVVINVIRGVGYLLREAS
jgi:DNA-binding response OmpR family regulator